MCGCNSVNYIGVDDNSYIGDDMIENFGGKRKAARKEKRQAKKTARKQARATIKTAKKQIRANRTGLGKALRTVAAVSIPGAMIPAGIIAAKRASANKKAKAQKAAVAAANPVRPLSTPQPAALPQEEELNEGMDMTTGAGADWTPMPQPVAGPSYEEPASEEVTEEMEETEEAPVEEELLESFTGGMSDAEKKKSRKTLLIGLVALLVLAVLVFFLTKHLRK